MRSEVIMTVEERGSKEGRRVGRLGVVEKVISVWTRVLSGRFESGGGGDNSEEVIPE